MAYVTLPPFWSRPAMPGSSETDPAQLPLLASPDDLQGLWPTFGHSFLEHHAGTILTDPRFAIAELVANCWDAGAGKVNIVWPAAPGDRIAVTDNGTGMTKDDFLKRWKELNYNRVENQGATVAFANGSKRRHRRAFGRNGIGRHAMFCFADNYLVETTKDGTRLRAQVSRAYGAAPFKIDVLDESNAKGHGTSISAETTRRVLPVNEAIDLIGSRFVSDPEFYISVNGATVTLTDLAHLCQLHEVPIPDFGSVVIRRFDTDLGGRTSLQNGVAWWTNGRKVGMPSWDAIDGPLLDARTAAGKRLTYVVEADQLAEDVKADWSDYHASQIVNAVRRAAYEFIRDDLRTALQGVRRERKLEALTANRHALLTLPPLSRETVARFVEDVQIKSPTISSKDLTNAVQVLATLEQARSGYSLLERLAKLSPDALDGLDSILDEWSVADIKQVLGELEYRLRLIKQLDALVETHTADELHDLQPLFERGLWIFGPEFESISFTSNRSLAKVVEKFLGEAALTTPKKRPDFVVLPDSSIGTYSADAFDKNHEVSGLASIVIVELKRGGHRVSHKEKDQAMQYSREIRLSGKVARLTKITCYVLGTELDPAAEEDSVEGATIVVGRTYQAMLRQAHARTFNLLEKVRSFDAAKISDAELDEVVNPVQAELPLASDRTRPAA